MAISKTFGENLKYYRKKKALSQEQLAELISIHPKHLSLLERGSSFTSAGLLESLCAVLEVSASALFYTPEEKSVDDSQLTKIDAVIDEEVGRAVDAIKTRIRERGE
jgi:putative transcriptional regulator